ncbi:MAG: hypothetical protein LM593_00510 [Candidatus Verstraetearchaeota archaeon]|jgi:hypothetical protein|nr:hypothetical protein [Candidatus Verstraetearchaeota archaeon]
MLSNFRDILIKKLGNYFLIISCDSSGAIGPKNGDFLKVNGEILGKYMVRSALMEILSVKAKPICISCGLGVEPEPTGESIIKGIKEEMIKVGLNPNEDLVISTEKNFPTNQTGLGITAIGFASKKDLLIGKSKKNDLIISIGLPSVGKEVLENKDSIVDIDDVLTLLSMDFIHGIIPVGSKGILYEANILARESNLKLRLFNDIKLDLKKSAGPSTVILVTLREKYIDIIKSKIKKPIHKIATLI